MRPAGDPAIYADRDGRFHYACWPSIGISGAAALVVASSNDGGQTWSSSGSRSSNRIGRQFQDKEMLTADLSPRQPVHNSLYVQWTRFTSGFTVARS
jgi:hypothetical protein